MVVTAALGAGAAYWATQAEEESIILKQRLVVGRLQEVAVWAHYSHQYGTWSILTNDAKEHARTGLNLWRTANSIRSVDQAEAERLDLQAQEEFAEARIYRTFYHFLKRPDDNLSIDESLAKDVSGELEKFGLGVDEQASDVGSQQPQAAGQHASSSNAAAMLELKLWEPLEHRIEKSHERVLKFSLAVILYVSGLVLFTFADLNHQRFGRACSFALVGVGVVAGTAAFSIATEPSFLIVVAVTSVIGAVIVSIAYFRGLFRPVGAEGEPLHAHEVENKSYWGASLFLRSSHDGRSRLAITLIAFSVFLSSGVGYLYVHASTKREELSHLALKNQVAFGRSSTTSASIAMAGGMQPTVIQIANQVHCMAARQQELFPRHGTEKKLSDFGGIGVEVQQDGGMRVKSVRADGAAAQAGVQPEDIITHIDGEDMAAMPLASVVNRLRGPIGAPVTIRLLRDKAKSPLELTLTRTKVTAEITVSDDTETLVRNSRMACAELKLDESIKQQELAQQYNYDSGYSPGSDMYYKLIYFLQRGNPARFYALADGYEELAALWSSKATVYLASLTLFAIALYLFGQALGVGSVWQVHTFLGFGGLLVAVSAGWALKTWVGLAESSPDVPAHCTESVQVEAHEPAERFVEIAAHHYGQAEALFNLGKKPADFGKVVDALRCSVASRMTFGRAHSLLSTALEWADAARRTDTYLPAPSWSNTREVIAERKRALRVFRSNNVNPSWMVTSNAFEELVLALVEGDRAALARALASNSEHVASDRKRGRKDGTTDPWLYLNYAVALLADNRGGDAEAIYRLGIDELGVAKDRRRVVEALTDLRMLETNCTHLQSAEVCKKLAPLVRKAKESLVAGKWQDGAIDRSSLSDVSIEVGPASVGWRGKLNPSTVHKGQKLTVVWYMLDPVSADGRPEGRILWRAIHGLTQTVDLGSLERNADGTVGSAVPYLREQGSCLAEGEYVPEIYIDGFLVSPSDLRPVFLKQFETYQSRYLNLVMCHPPGWRARESSWQMPMRLLSNAKGEATAALFTFYAARTTPSNQPGADHLEIAVKYLSETFSKPLSGQVVSNLIAGVGAFHGCSGTLSKGTIPHRQWVTPEGFIHIALVFPWNSVEDPCLILNSVENYFEPNRPSAK
jgi:hypothetical protein